jgi:hypothetical protein
VTLRQVHALLPDGLDDAVAIYKQFHGLARLPKDQRGFWTYERVLALREKIEVEHSSVPECAAFFGKSADTVRHAMARYGIRVVKSRRGIKAGGSLSEKALTRSPEMGERFMREWKRCAGFLRTMAIRRSRSEDEADDRLSIAIQKLWLGFDGFENRGNGSFNAWAATAVRFETARTRKDSDLDSEAAESLVAEALGGAGTQRARCCGRNVHRTCGGGKFGRVGPTAIAGNYRDWPRACRCESGNYGAHSESVGTVVPYDDFGHDPNCLP